MYTALVTALWQLITVPDTDKKAWLSIQLLSMNRVCSKALPHTVLTSSSECACRGSTVLKPVACITLSTAAHSLLLLEQCSKGTGYCSRISVAC